MLVDYFFSSFDLDAFCSVDPIFEHEPKPALTAEGAELMAVKIIMTTVKTQPVS